ncbi:DUF983 domain-containing protein [Enterovirga rhinocerotis]|uniref:Uncharacterized protein (DUF983 family) n=1 Tax=Enterovirga rhinocerotis TaxID=1339210 RepID=A0A4R7C709_9HYPH|nr:DUF983 domain-containing protein [Enterovirga rhinocerotis]TDR94384.1 uncharacterized protein (DUF983 family) [Enterovirga rhinocerotis]
MITMEPASRPSHARPDVVQAVGRGLRCRCPACGEGRLFERFLKVAPSCSECGQAFHHHRADDFPPYLVMFIVGHIVGYGIYVAETRYENVPVLFHALTWPTLAVVLCLALLQPVKGAVIGLQYGNGMHGFDPSRPGRQEETDERRKPDDGRARREAADGVPDGAARTDLAKPETP